MQRPGAPLKPLADRNARNGQIAIPSSLANGHQTDGWLARILAAPAPRGTTNVQRY